MTEVRQLDAYVDPHALHAEAPDRYPFLLQSTASTSTRGRFDVLFLAPDESIVADESHPDFLTRLDGWWQKEKIPATGSEFPFTGGWFLYLGYELAEEIEPGLSLGSDTLLPRAFAVRCRAALVRDNHRQASYLIEESSGCVDVQQLNADIVSSTATPAAAMSGLQPPSAVEDDADLFTDAVLQAKEYIAAGDIYQANLARGWNVTVDERLAAIRIYESLCKSNPGPFAGLARWQDTSIISSSPERLLRTLDGMAMTRPIAGTRPRSEDRSADDDLSTELFANPKERAEHIMLIDLERNDLGRICDAGSVEVDEMMALETYAHVHHIVSNVQGRLRADVTPGEAIRAVFPGGTITGCPKVRCMEIINELEAGPRGAYTGSFGYLNRDGSLDLNILIRTMVMQGNRVSFRAGSGIVADSEPLAELEETRAKAKGMLRALAQ